MELAWQKIVQSLNFTAVANLVNFAILVGILSRVLYGPTREFLAKRKERIQSRIENAKEREDQAEELKQNRQQELMEARGKARDIIEEAQETAERIKREGREEAKEEASQIIERAREEARQEEERLREELRSHYAEAALLGAERILEREVSSDDHKDLIESFLQDLEGADLQIE